MLNRSIKSKKTFFSKNGLDRRIWALFLALCSSSYIDGMQENSENKVINATNLNTKAPKKTEELYNIWQEKGDTFNGLRQTVLDEYEQTKKEISEKLEEAKNELQETKKTTKRLCATEKENAEKQYIEKESQIKKKRDDMEDKVEEQYKKQPINKKTHPGYKQRMETIKNQYVKKINNAYDVSQEKQKKAYEQYQQAEKTKQKLKTEEEKEKIFVDLKTHLRTQYNDNTNHEEYYKNEESKEQQSFIHSLNPISDEHYLMENNQNHNNNRNYNNKVFFTNQSNDQQRSEVEASLIDSIGESEDCLKHGINNIDNNNAAIQQKLSSKKTEINECVLLESINTGVDVVMGVLELENVYHTHKTTQGIYSIIFSHLDEKDQKQDRQIRKATGGYYDSISLMKFLGLENLDAFISIKGEGQEIATEGLSVDVSSLIFVKEIMQYVSATINNLKRNGQNLIIIEFDMDMLKTSYRSLNLQNSPEMQDKIKLTGFLSESTKAKLLEYLGHQDLNIIFKQSDAEKDNFEEQCDQYIEEIEEYVETIQEILETAQKNNNIKKSNKTAEEEYERKNKYDYYFSEDKSMIYYGKPGDYTNKQVELGGGDNAAKSQENNKITNLAAGSMFTLVAIGGVVTFQRINNTNRQNLDTLTTVKTK